MILKQIDMKDRYQKDKNFQKYVDRYCKAYNRMVADVLNLALVQEVARYYFDIESKVQTGKSTYVPLGECV